VGKKRCALCRQRISDLPEPPLLDWSIGLVVTMRVSQQASSGAEGRVLAFDALHMDGDGLSDWECTSQDSFLL
jgi:hypothetical protein